MKMISTLFFFLPFLLLYMVFAVYAERKISAFMQDRMGPMEVGYYGILQTVADLLKLIQKESIIPTAADKKLFLIAPTIIFTAVFAGFAVLPITPGWTGSDTELGIFYLLAIVSLDVVGILIAGWSSNNKYSLYGAIRAVSQIISYEVPMGLSVLCVIMISQTLNLQEISLQQGTLINHDVGLTGLAHNYLFGIESLGVETTNWGGILTWNILRAPILIPVFIIFFISSLAECNRAPFDLPEAESEIIGGFHTEYSGFQWALIMLSEYAMMLLVSMLAVVLFFGSWNTPFPNIDGLALADYTSGTPGTLAGHIWGGFWLISKTLILIFLQMWVRWTYPRLRVDQLMNLGWKYLTPAALVLIFLCAIWRLWMI